MLKVLPVWWARVRSSGRFAVAFHLSCSVALAVGFIGLWHLLFTVPDSGGPRVSVLASAGLDQTVLAFVGLVCMVCFVSTLAAGLVAWCAIDAMRVSRRKTITRNEKTIESWREMCTFATESELTFCVIAYRDLQDVGEREVWRARALGALRVWLVAVGPEASIEESQRMRGLFDSRVADEEPSDESCQVGVLEPA